MIYLNLIPSNLWYLNLRKILSKESWELLSKKIRNEQEYTCYCCKISYPRLPKNKFHCHEAWWFDDKMNQVSLKALLCVCELCHQSIHLGRNDNKNAFKRIMNVNNWDYEMTKLYVESEFETWSKRSNKSWNINIDSFEEWVSTKQFEEIKKFFSK